MRKYFLWLAPLLLVVFLFGFIQDNELVWKVGLLSMISSFAIGAGSLKALKDYQYTFWIIAAVFAGLLFPDFFLNIGGFDLRNKWLILIIIQLVMFGMGTQMSIKDFTSIRKFGKAVLIGLLAQFTIMPIIGFTIAKTFGFEPEIAAGIVLIGSCSSGLASNVMTYIAKGDLVLSVTVTAISTLTAPIMTTLLMKTFAGTFIEIDFFSMMMSIVKIVLVPLLAAMIHDALKIYGSGIRKKINYLSILSGIWLVGVFLFRNSLELSGASSTSNALEIVNFLAAAFVVGSLYHLLYKAYSNVDKFMPYFSMFGIVYFTLVTTAAGRDNLIQIGVLLFVAAILHNSAGYFLGYWLSRLGGLDKVKSQTIAFEVGLQNGGMASGLAGSMGKLATLGLAAAVFSPWMNISGSLLANFWRKRRES
ncbi:bile acid:sodium symporter family protein [Thalassobellus citreus]|uniref:bile acid:sodium symporter family protein n=1 Tax=Thalassobellus citreus TaxID=3367752 RepID=UPI0037B012E2